MAARKRPTLKTLRKQLEERLADLHADSTSSKDSRRPVELDQAVQGRLSRMDALQQQAMAVETERRREIEITRIEAALKRMDSDDYGYCVRCDEEIAPGRLSADPSEPLCIECADDRSLRR